MEIFIYLSEDGIWRQRCKAHISTEPGKRPRSPAVGHMRFQASAKRTCIACYYQKQNALASLEATSAQEQSTRSTHVQPHSTTNTQDDQ